MALVAKTTKGRKKTIIRTPEDKVEAIREVDEMDVANVAVGGFSDPMTLKYQRLNGKQRRWIDCFMVNRNATLSAEMAGYGGQRDSLRKMGFDNKHKFADIINAFDDRAIDTIKNITNVEDLMKFWVEIVADNKRDVRYRIKASELLGRAFGAFSDENNLNVQVKNDSPLKQLDVAELKALARKSA